MEKKSNYTHHIPNHFSQSTKRHPTLQFDIKLIILFYSQIKYGSCRLLVEDQ